MNKQTIRVGGKVTIFEDPLTQKKPEGVAIVKEVYRDTDVNLYRCRVIFDDEPEGHYDRTVLGVFTGETTDEGA